MDGLILSMIMALCTMGFIWFLCCAVVLLFQLVGWVTALILVLFAGLTTVIYLTLDI